jgi:hypothetical protein
MNTEVIEVFEGQVPERTTSKKANINETEKNISLVAGSFILWKSLKNIFSHPTLAIYGLVLGGALVYRGTTGYCPLYDNLGIISTERVVPIDELTS